MYGFSLIRGIIAVNSPHRLNIIDTTETTVMMMLDLSTYVSSEATVSSKALFFLPESSHKDSAAIIGISYDLSEQFEVERAEST
jgi:hypothetical protein